MLLIGVRHGVGEDVMGTWTSLAACRGELQPVSRRAQSPRLVPRPHDSLPQGPLPGSLLPLTLGLPSASRLSQQGGSFEVCSIVTNRKQPDPSQSPLSSSKGVIASSETLDPLHTLLEFISCSLSPTLCPKRGGSKSDLFLSLI